jgi:hypothetical protein
VVNLRAGVDCSPEVRRFLVGREEGDSAAMRMGIARIDLSVRDIYVRI